MRLHALLAPVALLALAACGGPLLSAEVEIDRFCYTQRVCGTGSPNCLPAMPTVPAAASIPAVAGFSVPLQLPPLLRNKGSEVEVRLLEARIHPTSASTDLRGIASLELALQPASGTPVTVAQYTRPGAATSAVPTIRLTGRGVDVIGILQSGSMQVRLGGGYDAPYPSAAWDADLEVCFAGRALMPYL